MRAELQALTVRVATLEQKEAQRSGMVSLVGTYALDRTAFGEQLVQGALKSTAAYLAGIEDAEERARAREAIEDTARRQAEQAELSLTLSPDGTFVMQLKLEGEAEESRGTWTSREAAIELRVTHRDEEALGTAEAMTARLAGGTLRLKPSPDDAVVFVLQKR